jgi:hypothetical protein
MVVRSKIKLSLGSLPFPRLVIDQGHMLVVGPTGSGKTNTVKVVLEELEKNEVPSLVLDFHGEYDELPRVTPGEDLSFNMLATQEIEFIVDILSSVFQVSEPQWYILLKALKRGKPPYRLVDVISLLEEEAVRDWREYEIKSALLRRLTILNEGILGKTLNGDNPPSFLFEKTVAVDLSRLPVRYRGLLSLIILKHLYDYVTSKTRPGRIMHATVIEEAWNILTYRARWEQPTIGERLFLELRKYGELVIAVSQRLDDLSERAVYNSRYILLTSFTQLELQKLGCQLQASELLKYTKLKRGVVLCITENCRIRRLKVRRAKRSMHR